MQRVSLMSSQHGPITTELRHDTPQVFSAVLHVLDTQSRIVFLLVLSRHGGGGTML
jgi:hypothetical protein